MDSKVELMQREVLSLSPELRQIHRDSMTARRVPNMNEVANMICEEVLPFADEEIHRGNHRTINTFIVASPETHTTHLPPGATVVEDKLESFLKQYPAGQPPDDLVVTKDSLSLRSVTPIVDNQLHVEAIIDPGCQIIAMSENCCHELALAYDPKVVLNMQSANGEVDRSLGLARNVPFTFGEITIYLQVHIIRSPAYEILLGRPFDVLTSSVVKNFSNEDQTLTLHDPNTDRHVTIPTIPRSRSRYDTREQNQYIYSTLDKPHPNASTTSEDFCNSRI